MARRLISFPFLVMLAWTVFLGWLLKDSQYQLFLAPKFGFLIYLSFFLSIAYLLSLGVKKIENRTDHFLKGMILILPILFSVLAGESTLGHFALSKRIIAPVQTGSTQPLEPEPPEASPTSGPKENGIPLVSISQLVRNWEAHNGKRISVEGLFSESVADHAELSAVFRYFITCCVADAMPVGVFLANPKEAGLKNDDWVRVSGTVRMDQLDGYDIILMEMESIEKRQMPSKNAAYLFD